MEGLEKLMEAHETIAGFSSWMLEAETEDDDNNQTTFLCQKTDRYTVGSHFKYCIRNLITVVPIPF